jgi:predicted ATP-binding protein involved in virulence
MRLDHLHLQNFRCYEDAQFDFNSQFNLIIGVNGSGKTSLLRAIAASFADTINTTGRYSPVLEEQDAHFFLKNYDGLIRFERKFPIVVEATGQLFKYVTWGGRKERESNPLVDAYQAAKDGNSLLRSDFEKDGDLPILAFYRSGRKWSSPSQNADEAVSTKVSRLDGYAGWFDAASSLKEFEQWFIGKTLERLQKIARTKRSIDFDDELTWLGAALKQALPQCEGIEYDLDIRSLVVHWDKATTLPFDSLSDGQRGMIALFADIARRMCLLNPHMRSKVLTHTSGLVIIDELDMHLHPAWQRHIAGALTAAFPKVQFVTASHSPQIIGSLKPEEVIMLSNGDVSHPRVTYGLDSSSVLEEVMGVSKREQEIDQLLNELFTTLADNDITKATQQLAALKSKAPDLPEFAGAEALIKRKEILGK